MSVSLHQFWIVMGLTTIAGLATGIGGLLAFFSRPGKDNGRFLSASLGFSGGVMVFISLAELMPEARHALVGEYGSPHGGLLAMLALAAGMVITAVIDKMIPEVENPHHVRSEEEFNHAGDASEDERRKLGRSGLMFALAIGIHNFPEGLATFAGGLSGMDVALPLTCAIALHNIPEGIAIAVPIFYATGNRKKAFMYSLFSGLAEPVGALIGFLILMPFLSATLLAILFAIVAGIMIYITFDELLPMAETYGQHHIVLAGLLLGMLGMGAVMEFM
ncbi:MAG: zinc transporter ZupT [Victivallaceae bacterium]